MIYISLFLFLTAALITDLRTMRIPNVLNGAGILIGIVLNIVVGGWQGLTASGIGLITGFSVMLMLHLIGAVGAGDVKLFAAIGALSGAAFTLAVLSHSILYAGCIGIVLAMLRRKLGSMMKDVAGSTFLLLQLRDTSALSRWRNESALQFPFMTAVMPGAVTTYVVWYW